MSLTTTPHVKTALLAGLLWTAISAQQLIDFAGPYAGPPNVNTSVPSDAIARTDSRIVSWATQVENYTQGASLSSDWTESSNALGAAEGNSFDIVSLGQSGSITLGFATPIANGSGADFTVFENSFDGYFLELAWVEVSSDGINFTRFPTTTGWSSPVSSFGSLDPTYLSGFAGKYQQGYGVPFDLSDLPNSNTLDKGNINYVRIIDIYGDGSHKDSSGNAIYDPTPTSISAGFDLDGVGVINEASLSLYQQWAIEQALPTGNTAANDDPDHDGATNLLEYWAGTSPTNAAEKPEWKTSKINSSTFEVVYSQPATATEFELIILKSSDLNEWSPVTTAPIYHASLPISETHSRITARYTLETNQTLLFVQFQVQAITP